MIVTPVTLLKPDLELASMNLFSDLEVSMFSHTQNENGTYNTRCLYCFMTIASAVESLEILEDLEMHHVCPEKALADLLARTTSSESHAQHR